VSEYSGLAIWVNWARSRAALDVPRVERVDLVQGEEALAHVAGGKRGGGHPVEIVRRAWWMRCQAGGQATA
jgi:hypothetical protein